jgi:hypothetical protein
MSNDEVPDKKGNGKLETVLLVAAAAGLDAANLIDI